MRKKPSFLSRFRNPKEFLKNAFPPSPVNESLKRDKYSSWIVLLLAFVSILTYLYFTGKYYEEDKKYQISKKRFIDSIERMLEAPVTLDSAFLHTATYDT